MSVSRAALFLLQRDSFSCSNAHSFNRLSSLQVVISVSAIGFSLVSCGFSAQVSLVIPSFHERDVLVILPSIEPIQPASSRSSPRNQKQLVVEGFPILD